MMKVLLTIVWFSSPTNEVVKLYTPDMEYCKAYAAEVLKDGANYTYCTYKVIDKESK